MTAKHEQTNVDALTTHELDAWAAGFFDGEGCIQIGLVGGFPSALNITVSQIQVAPLERLQHEYGGTTYQIRAYGAKKHGCYRWGCSGRVAAAFLIRVLPYLTVKRTAATVAIEYQVRLAQSLRGSSKEWRWSYRSQIAKSNHVRD